MFLYKFRLFSLFGFEVSVDASWLLLAALIAWTLADSVFPELTPGLTTAGYWTMGVAATLGLLSSIVLHETAHSLVARRYGMPIRGITLFIFGGVAEMSSEPRQPRDELLMAAAGPAASLVLAAGLYALYVGIASLHGATAIAAIAWYLALLNAVLVLFNLVPAFPLDGGRILRAVLWWSRGDVDWATRVAANAGSLFGALLIVLGLLRVLQGDFIGGMWWFLIGLFLRGAAASSYGEAVSRRLLAVIPVARIMNPDPVVVPAATSLQDFFETYVYRFHHRWFPVVDTTAVRGTIVTQQAVAVDRVLWGITTVGEVMRPLSPDEVVAPDTIAFEALAQMRRTGQSRLLVMHGSALVGILSSRDLLEVLSLEQELHAGGGRPGNSPRPRH